MERLRLIYLFGIVISAFAVIQIDNTGWIEDPGNPIYDPTDHRAYYPSVLFEDGYYKMWYDDGSAIRLANSSDGIVWNYIAICTGLQNPRHAAVLHTSEIYEIWYWDSGVPGVPYNNESIRHADSVDGIAWFNDTPIVQDPQQLLINVSGGVPTPWNRGSYGPCSMLFDDSLTELNTTHIMNNRYVMYYDGTTGGDESIGIAGSADGHFWVGNPTGLPVFGLPPADPYYFTRSTTVVYMNELYSMWYSWGYNSPDDCIGYAESLDGLTWEDDPNNPIFCINDSVVWRAERTYTPSVILNNTHAKMWFSGLDVPGGNYAIGYATMFLPTTTPLQTTPEPEPTAAETTTEPETTLAPTTAPASIVHGLLIAILLPSIFVVVGFVFLCVCCSVAPSGHVDEEEEQRPRKARTAGRRRVETSN